MNLEKKKFEYKSVPLRNIEVEVADPTKLKPEQKVAHQGGSYLHGGKMIKSVLIDGEPIVPTGRFWNSLYSRFSLNKSFFKYFSHPEVFSRIVEKSQESSVRVCIERDTITGDSRLLAATGLNKPVIIYDDLLEMLENIGTDMGTTRYANGIVTSTHQPRLDCGEFSIAGDAFRNQFELSAPIDGYGNPNFYLSLLRLICSNGAVGMARSFQSTLKLGTGSDNIEYTLQRALDGFQNEEGYALFRERFAAAAHCWASLREQQEVYRLLLGLQNDSQMTSERALDITSKFEKLAGKPTELFNSDPNLFSSKRLGTLPVECKMYDMINFVTEVATHDVSEESARTLQAWVGTVLDSEYDLEGSCDAFDDWREFFVSDNRARFEREKNARE